MEWSELMNHFELIGLVDSDAIIEMGLVTNDGAVRLYSCVTCAAVVSDERLDKHVEWHDQNS